MRKRQHTGISTTERDEMIARWVQLITLAASCYNVGTIWMTQFGYRLWALIKPGEFATYHRTWWEGWQGVQPIVFPSGIIATLGSLAQLRWRSPRIPRWLALANLIVQIQSWLWTAIFWAPLQARLQQTRREDGTLDPGYRRLLTTHWLRVALFSANGALQFWMAVISFLARD